MDVVTLNEASQARWIAEQAEERRYRYDLSPKDLVLDIGAHTGEFSREIFRRYGCKIIAVEPTDYIDGFRDGTVIKKAASDHDGCDNFAGLSLYTSPFGPRDRVYPCFDLNHLLRFHTDVALMKVNIEGGEYKLLKHVIASGLHRRIRNLQVQFHQVLDQPFEEWYFEIAVSLSQTHHLTWKYPFCWENWCLLLS